MLQGSRRQSLLRWLSGFFFFLKDSTECQWESGEPFMPPVDLGMPRYTPISPVSNLASHVFRPNARWRQWQKFQLKRPTLWCLCRKTNKIYIYINIYVPGLFRRRKCHEKLPRFHRHAPSLIVFSLSKQMGKEECVCRQNIWVKTDRLSACAYGRRNVLLWRNWACCR